MKRPGEAADLRLRAERSLRDHPPKSTPQLTHADSQRQLHELEVHQIELELQNAELQKARDELEVALEKYTDLYDFAPAGFFSLADTGLILESNLTGAAMLGVDRSHLINGRLRQFVTPASRPVLLAFLGRILAGGGKQVCEVELLKKDGVAFWASLHGTSALSISGPRKWCRVAMTDITSRRQADELLRQNEALFSALIQQAPVGVYVVDGQMRMQEVNRRAESVFANIKPLIGRSFSEVVHIVWPKKVADAVEARFRHTLQTGKPYIATEFTEQRHDSGATESYEWQLQRITLPAGQHGVVCFFNDVTERKQIEATQRRLAVLAASNRKLEQEIARRQAVEQNLQKSEETLNQLLQQSQLLQGQLRHLSRQLLSAQEEERKRISRELHDVIAQTLTGINVRLAALTTAKFFDPQDLKQKISSAQRLVEESVAVVHRFALELRPAVLDDLGLIPALHSYVKNFSKRTRLHVGLQAYAAVNQLEISKRTVLFRVTQEALTNIDRHARASRVDIKIVKQSGTATLTVADDGKSFKVDRVMHAKRNQRLGLLGMRERVEMVGGTFAIESIPGKGTTIRAVVPLGGGGAENAPMKPLLDPNSKRDF